MKLLFIYVNFKYFHFTVQEQCRKFQGRLLVRIGEQLKTTTISAAVFPSTSKALTELSENIMDRQRATLNRSKSESEIKLDHLSIRSKGKISTSLTKQATNLPPAVKKGIVPKGVAKLKQSLSFRDKKPVKFGEPKLEQSPTNSKIKSPALKTETAGTFKYRSGKVLKNQEKNRSKAESVINHEKVNRKTNANKITETKQQICKASNGKDKQVKSLDKQDIFPEFKDAIQDASELQKEFCTPKEIGHSGLKLIEKPKKKALPLPTRIRPSQISNKNCDSSGKLPKKEFGGHV
nr:uncharacterized protein LOC107439994 isoform X2 [Parasteatoda tepidariorum]